MTMLLPVAVMLILLIFCAMAATWDFVLHHGAHHVIYRMLTGHHLDGHHRSNRTWMHRGTHSAGHDHRVHVGRWARTPRAHRAAITWVLILAVPYTLYGLATETSLTENLWIAALAALTAYTLLRIARRLAHRYHHRHVVGPVACALSGHLGLTPSVVQENLRISPRLEIATPGTKVGSLRNLPDTWHGLEADQEWIENLLSARLPVQLEYVWHLTRHPMSMEMLCASAPPVSVTLKDYMQHIQELQPGQYFLGAGADGVLRDWDCLEEDPEGAVGSRTRGGKTNLLSAVIAQGLARGEEFWACDPKRVSLRHFTGVPGFRLANDPRRPQEMVSLIIGFARLMDAAIEAGDTSHHRTLILEEMNQLQNLLDDWWIQVKARDQRMLDNPAWRAVKAILHQGAQFNHRVLVSGQDLKDKALFGSRSQFGTVLMNRYTSKQWSYTAGTTPVPPPPVKKGRFWLIQGSDTTLIQVLCADPRKGHGENNERIWREYALAGRVPEEAVPPRWRRYPDRVYRAILPPPVITPLAIPPILVGYREAAQYLGLSENAFKQRRKRNPVEGEFRTDIRGGDRPCWHKDTLDLWFAGFRASPASPDGEGVAAGVGGGVGADA